MRSPSVPTPSPPRPSSSRTTPSAPSTTDAGRPRSDLRVEDQALVELLRGRGQRVTPQRLVVHRVLGARRTHLSAEQVHAAVSSELPGTSLPTIYATLDLFAELGLLQRVAGGRSALFDTRLEPHAHAVCRRCQAVTDIELTGAIEPVLDRARAAGFEVDRADAWIGGLCPRCAGRRD